MRALSSFLIALLLSALAAAQVGGKPQLHRLDSTKGLTLIGVKADAVTYKGRKAVRLLEDPAAKAGPAVVLVPGTDFANGVIEFDIAAMNAPEAAPDMRGFAGMVFRAAPDASRFENFYLRPTNGRADDQLRRNHSTQYTSHPDYPWHKLRKENPGVYESYTDLEPGVWTKMRIEVEGQKARLYVNGAPQPCLIVNDLKLGADARGLVGLWIGAGAEAYFADLRITYR